MLNLEIKTEDGWRGLQIAQDTSIEMEHRSWLWDEESAGGFSHSFEIDIDANRELFGNSQEVHGERVRSVLEGKKMRMSVMGVPFLFGIVRLDDEIHIEDGKVDIEFCSENQEFNDLIGDMKCTDVKVKDKICVGTVADRMDVFFDVTYSYEGSRSESHSFKLPPVVFETNKILDNGSIVSTANVSKPYPEAAYCNMRICIQHRKKNEDGSYEETREYEVFEADRPDSGVCFYVLYFLDCLFLQLGISFDNSALRAMEDFCRLAFFTTKCEYDKDMFSMDCQDLYVKILEGLELIPGRDFQSEVENLSYKVRGVKKFANSKNFPTEDVSSLIDSLKSAFAMRLKFNHNNTSCKAVLMRDVLRDQAVVDIDALVISEEKSEEAVDGYVLKYSGSDDDTMYNYDINETNVVYAEYGSLKASEQKSTDMSAYYDKKTGNMYRVKVDDDAESEDELFPSLFEVGGLQEAWLGDKDSDTAQKKEIGFSPTVSNVIEYTVDAESAGLLQWTVTKKDKNFDPQKSKYAVFVPIELEAPHTLTIKEEMQTIFSYSPHDVNYVYSRLTFTQRYGYTKDYVEKYNARPGLLYTTNPVPQFNKSPFAEYDSGLALTIMRGPGNEAGIETFDDDYDGEGNAKYQTVASNYNSCIDSIDHYGNEFDYNGTAEGGVDYSGRFSLKPSAKKRQGTYYRIVGGEYVVRSKEEAKYWMDYYMNFKTGGSLRIVHSDNINAMNIYDMPFVKASELRDAGWDVDTNREYYVLYPIRRNLIQKGYAGNYVFDKWVYLNAFTKEGQVYSKTTVDDCLREDKDYFYPDSGAYLNPLIIQSGELKDGAPSDEDSEKFIRDLIGLADVYYGLADEYTLTGLEDTPDSMYYPIDSVHANRGLLETFHMEQAYFLMNKKILTRKCQMGLAELLRLLENWEHKVRIGDVVGYIYSVKYSLSMDKGVSDVEVVMWYL